MLVLQDRQKLKEYLISELHKVYVMNKLPVCLRYSTESDPDSLAEYVVSLLEAEHEQDLRSHLDVFFGAGSMQFPATC